MISAAKAIRAPTPASTYDWREMCTSSGPPPERAANAGVGPSAEITVAAIGGPVAKATAARITPSSPYWASS